MGYQRTIQDAARWLASNVNPDMGWGMSPGQASSIVNTAEAIYILTRAKGYGAEIENGLDYISNRLFKSLEEQGGRTRYVLFALFALTDHLEKVDSNLLLNCTDWLLRAQNSDGGWGHVTNDSDSRIFPTCFAVCVLRRLGVGEERLLGGFNWILGQGNPSGWSFNGGNVPSPTATAQAVVALRELRDSTSDIFIKPKELLLATDHWGTERENLPGTLWDHCTYMWIFPALTALGVDPYAPTIAEGIRAINRLAGPNGWTEPSGGESIRGQFWAVFALNTIKETFDPAVHVYKIDSERAQQALTEPSFVNVFVHTRWAMVIPQILYRGLTYLFIAVFFVAFTGVYRSAPRFADLLASSALAVVIYFLITRRKHLFPKWLLRILIIVAGALSFVNLFLGWSVKDIFTYTTK